MQGRTGQEGGGAQTMTGVRRPSHHLKARCSIGAPAWHKILGPFQDHHIAPDVKYLLKSFFYRLS